MRCMKLLKVLSNLYPEPENNKNLQSFIEKLYQDHTLALLSKYEIGFMKNNNELKGKDDFNYLNFHHEFFNIENLDMHMSIAST